MDAISQFPENKPKKQGIDDDDKWVIRIRGSEFALQNSGNSPRCATAGAIVSTNVFDDAQAAPLLQAFQRI